MLENTNMHCMFGELLWSYFAFNCEVSTMSTGEKQDWYFHDIKRKQHGFTVETLIKLDSQIHQIPILHVSMRDRWWFLAS